MMLNEKQNINTYSHKPLIDSPIYPQVPLEMLEDPDLR